MVRSARPSAGQDATQIASDLHTLLQRGNVPGSYVLAGYSFGGLYVLTFAARYHLASLSSNSAHRGIDGASHPGLILEKKYAASTAQAILDVVDSVRSTSQLH
jgi:pimeloyl-ACP methyl ester carboxylesterase